MTVGVPVVSVLIPTRGRVEMMKGTVASFLDKATVPDHVEVLVRVHEDDGPSMEWARTRDRRIRVVVGDTEGGYESVHKFVNVLAAASNGGWLWVNSDDTRMVTQGWDEVLRGWCKEPEMELVLLTPRIVNIPGRRVPVLSRGLYEVVGAVGRTAHDDCYIDALAGMAGVRHEVDIELRTEPTVECGPRDVTRTWAQYRSVEVARKFGWDKVKVGAVLGKRLGGWTTSDAPVEP